MKKYLLLVPVLLLALAALAAPAAYYTWTDENGGKHFSDKLDQLPKKYKNILRTDQDKREVGGVGYYKDEGGVYRFYDVKPAPPEPIQELPVVERFEAPGLHNTAGDDSWRGAPNLQIIEAKVKKAVSADTLLLEDGTKITFIGVAFPAELKSNSALHGEAKAYLEQLLAGQTIALLFGPQRTDDKGRTLAFVHFGTDNFVNADLLLHGYAEVKTVPPNTEYRDLFLRLEAQAQEQKLGIWKEK